jgi:uncharacterized protein
MPAVSHSLPWHAAEFRFYAELNDFLPRSLRGSAVGYGFNGTPLVKDAIEAIGVPHPEIDLVLVDGVSVDFGRRLAGGERVAVYPVFERFDIAPVTHLRARPLRRTRFVLDVHLGKLARLLRLLGFDTRYRNDYDDAEIIAISLAEKRVILTRDKGILKHGTVTHGYWVCETDPRRQLDETVRAFDLFRDIRSFSRCLACNGELREVDKDATADRIPRRVRDGFEVFAQCCACQRIYWPGSHYEKLRRLIDAPAPI